MWGGWGSSHRFLAGPGTPGHLSSRWASSHTLTGTSPSGVLNSLRTGRGAGGGTLLSRMSPSCPVSPDRQVTAAKPPPSPPARSGRAGRETGPSVLGRECRQALRKVLCIILQGLLFLGQSPASHRGHVPLTPRPYQPQVSPPFCRPPAPGTSEHATEGQRSPILCGLPTGQGPTPLHRLPC